jgi:hypothetical protein
MKLNAPGVMQGFLNAEKDITAEDERKKNDAYKMQEMQAREQAMNYQAYQQGQQQLADKQVPVNNFMSNLAQNLDVNDPIYAKLFVDSQQQSGPPPVTANAAPQQASPNPMAPPGGAPQQASPNPMAPPGAAPAPAPGQASTPPRPIPTYNTVPGMAQASQAPPAAQPRVGPPAPAAPPPVQPQRGGAAAPGSQAAAQWAAMPPDAKAKFIQEKAAQSQGFKPDQVQAALGSTQYQNVLKTRREDAKFALETKKENFAEAEKKTADAIAERKQLTSEASQKETVRRDSANIATAQGQLKVAQGNLGVNQGRLALEKASKAAAQVGGAINPALLQSLGSQYRAGMPLSALSPGYSAAGQAKRLQIQAEGLKQVMAEHPEMTPAQAGLELANSNIMQAAGKKSIGQLTTMQGSTKQAVDQLKYNIDQVKEDFKKLPSSDLSPVINAIARGQQKWTGDPAYSSLFFHMHASAMESARLLSGGTASIAQLNPMAAAEAQKWADVGMTPKSFIEGSAPAMLGEGDNRLKTFTDAIKYQKLGGAGQKGTSETPKPEGKVMSLDEFLKSQVH